MMTTDKTEKKYTVHLIRVLKNTTYKRENRAQKCQKKERKSQNILEEEY